MYKWSPCPKDCIEMYYPIVTVNPGSDVDDIIDILNINDIPCKIHFTKPQEKTKLHIESFSKTIFNINDLQKGLNLSFFKSEPVELEWDVKNCIPTYWELSGWDHEIASMDISCWISNDSNIVLDAAENLIVTTIINHRIHSETEMLKIYNDVLIPTIQHPDIQNMLRVCIVRKEAHIKMWYHIKAKLRLTNLTLLLKYVKRGRVTIFDRLVYNLAELISREGILNPSASKCLTLIPPRKDFDKFIKIIKRRDKESIEHSKILTILLQQIKKLYPFLDEVSNEYIVETNFRAYTKDLNFL